MPETTVRYPAAELVQRRCWRCLQMFAVDGPVPVREDFWLCDPCSATLLPSKQQRRS